MASVEAAPRLHVEVVFSAQAASLWHWRGELPAGATLEDALRLSGLLEAHPQFDIASAVTGIWGRKAPLSQALREGDRVEVYRGLQVDPKEARRLRYRRHREARSGPR